MVLKLTRGSAGHFYSIYLRDHTAFLYVCWGQYPTKIAMGTCDQICDQICPCSVLYHLSISVKHGKNMNTT